jgi:hypothetical protein
MISMAKERCAKLVAKFQGKKISELAILRQWVQGCHLMHCSHTMRDGLDILELSVKSPSVSSLSPLLWSPYPPLSVVVSAK